jgi:molecular chaperone IbpA
LLKEDVAMRTALDFSPLYRSTVGFDRLFNMLDSTMGDCRGEQRQLAALQHRAAWRGPVPHHHGGRGLHARRDQPRPAGEHAPGRGRKHPEPEGVQVLHRGIATRAFRQTFNLADYVKVSGANLENGLLVIDLCARCPRP